MPGFNINNGGARTGQNGYPNGKIEMRRVHRWVFETINGVEGMSGFTGFNIILKTASRPAHKFDPVEVHHNQEEVWLAGKTHWDPITMTWYDAEQDPDCSAAIWDWLGGEAGPTSGPYAGADQKCSDGVGLMSMAIRSPRIYKGVADLILLNGVGCETERWKLHNGWPLEVNWQGLDYTTSDILTCEVSYRYDRAERIGGA